MNADLDQKIAHALRHWEAPPPSPDAIARILAAAQPNPAQTLVTRRRMLFAGPALAAAMAIGIVSYSQHEALPKNEPVLAQSALSVFSIASATPDAEELP